MLTVWTTEKNTMKFAGGKKEMKKGKTSIL